MSKETLKAIVAFLAGLILTAGGIGYWFGHNVPTQCQVDELIEQVAETNFLLRAHNISWEALQHEPTATNGTDMAAPADTDSGRCDPGDDCVGASDD